METYICEKCGKPADWMYIDDTTLCDDCVPRGCSCNLELKDDIEFILDEYGNIDNPEEDYHQPLDEYGREYPCCEWMYINERDEENKV